MEVSGKSRNKDVEEVDAVLCQPCQERNQSTQSNGFCAQCREHMCVNCFDTHKQFKLNRGHSLADGNVASVTVEQNDDLQKCDEHFNELVKFYCPMHKQVGCGDCMILEHKVCKVEYIRNKARKFADSVEFKGLVNDADKCLTQCKETAKSIKNNKVQVSDISEKFIKDVEMFSESLISHINKMKTSMIRQASMVKSKDLDTLEKLEKENEVLMEDISSLAELLKSQTEQPCKLFVSYVIKKPRLKQLVETHSKIENQNSLKNYQFNRNGNLEQAVKETRELGSLQEIKLENDETGLRNLDTPAEQSALTKKTTLTYPLAGTERSNKAFDEELRAKVCEVSKKKGRFKEKFAEDVRARIDQASTRTSSDFSPEDMEVFKKPMCLVWTERNMLKMDDKTVKEINGIPWPMIIVAVVGPYRTGKSYLMNMLAGAKDGFAVGDTIGSKTKGIWVWCVIHPQKPNTVLLLIDTEGLGDIDKGDPSYDNKIFILATLLCNCLVYNMKGAFDQDAVSKLTFFTEMTKNIRFRKTSSQENNCLSLIMPEFLLCLRDFSLKLVKDKKRITEDEYLEECLKEQKGKGDEFNKPSECIKKYFPVRKCFTFPVLGDAEVLENLETMSFDDLSNRFKEATTRFVSYVYSLKPKELLASKPINGLMFTTLANHYVTAIRYGAIPGVDDAFLATVQIENSRIKDNALKIFKESMAEIKLPVPSTDLDDMYKTAECETLGYLRKNVVFDRDGHFEMTTQYAMDEIWNEYRKKNIDKILGLCNEKIQDAFKSLKENIDKKVYEVAGGHRKFQRDVNLMKDEFMCSLRDFKDHEILLTWLAFLETLKTTESEIIDADDNLSKQEKEDEKRLNEERMKKHTEEHERNKTEVLEEQRKLIREHLDNLKKEREIQVKEEQERYKELLEVKLERELMQKEMERLKKPKEEKQKQYGWFHRRLYDAFLNE